MMLFVTSGDVAAVKSICLLKKPALLNPTEIPIAVVVQIAHGVGGHVLAVPQISVKTGTGTVIASVPNGI
jgi:hypothetical protein